MNKIFILLLIVFVTSCSKDKDFSKQAKEFSGEWEIEKFIGFPDNQDYPAGNGEIIILKKDGSFERKEQNVVVFTGRFYLENKKDCGSSKKETFFSTNDSTYSWDSKIKIENNKLLLESSNCFADGGVSFYRKLNDVD
jgi:hypothetical protein